VKVQMEELIRFFIKSYKLIK